MLRAKIKVQGKTTDDLVIAIEEALRLIREGNTLGYEKDDDGGYYEFGVSGEEKE